eukprot:g6014.t1
MPVIVDYVESQTGLKSNSKTMRPVGPSTSTKSKFFSNLSSRRCHGGMAIGGHRGMGENLISEDHEMSQRTSYWRENTIKSFLKAVEHGATFVEFDVQVTSDGVPVIWHDDFISYGSPETPNVRRIRHLTFQEFQSIGHRRALDDWKEPSPVYRHYKNETTGVSSSRYWKCSNEDELPSLEQVFEKIPHHVGFNIEIKMNHSTATDQGVLEEVEFVTSAVLSVVEKYSNAHLTRAVVFSSFDPLVVKKLKLNHKSVVAMFLTTGMEAENDVSKESTFSTDIDWAYTNGLDGVVLDSTILRKNQEVIGKALALGLIVMTYGLENNDHDWVLSQFHLGVHGAIVDDVEKVISNIVHHLI